VLVRSTANQCCYSLTGGILSPSLPPRGYFATPWLGGHAGLGVVEAIGPEVRWVKPGDKVFIAGTSQCNLCYNCVRGRSDACLANNLQAGPVAQTLDGVPLQQTAGIGGLAEYVVNYEERLVPYVSDLPDEIVAMLPDAVGTGLGITTTLRPIEAGSTVVVIGCGPIGLSAIQGARLQGAIQIIAVEPIKARRDLALKLGAHQAIDPNSFEPGKLLTHLQELTTTTSHEERMFFGDRHRLLRGPDYVIEAVGRQAFTPKVEQARDPTGIEAFEMAVNLVAKGGYGLMAGGYGAEQARVTPNGLTIGSKTLISCQNGGMQTRRDLPRFLRLIEQGKIDVQSLISKVYPFEDVVQAFQDAADRTVIAAVVKF
jgi:S-(hydroxymethyl)glutathione dehydrogenase/alcohol dehydrogenase